MSKVGVHGSFDDLSAASAACFDAAGSYAGFFSCLSWFRHLSVTCFRENSELRIYEAQAADGSAILLPLLASEAHRLSAAANFYTPLFVPVGGSVALSGLNALAEKIAAERPRWSCIDLRPLPQGEIFDGLAAAFRRAGMAVQPYFCFGNWYLPVEGRSWEQYRSSLPSQLKNTLKRKSQRLEASGALRIEVVAAPASTAEAIAAYEKIYRSSWKRPEPFPDFVPGLIRLCAEKGWLRMGIAYVEGEPAAAQIWIVHSGVASIYKLAYDEKFGSLSVGTVLTAHMMRHALDVERVREVDYLNGDEAYKRDWMTHRRERWGLMAFNPRTARGLAAACRHIGGAKLKALAERFRKS